jgi:hypothetical protein
VAWKNIYSSVFHLKQWARSTITLTPSTLIQELKPSLVLLENALVELSTTYTKQISPLVPRPALLLVGSIASSTYLLEHAIWSYTQKESEAELDVEVFNRWIVQSGLEANILEVSKAKDAGRTQERVKTNKKLVFGTKL